jgi:hypothetical protein
MRRLLSVLLLAASPALAVTCPSGYGYAKVAQVQTGQVTGTLTDFPALILNPASAMLKTVANGGHVTSASGYDIIPVSSTGTLLPFQLVAGSYAATTGAMQMWVKVPSLANGTTINLCYGNSGVTTYQGNNATTWAAFGGVYHSEDNASSTAVADATTNGNNGAAAANTSGKSATGKIGNGLTYNGITDYVDLGNPTTLQAGPNQPFTYSAWVKPTVVSSEQDVISWYNGAGGNLFGFSSGSNVFVYRGCSACTLTAGTSVPSAGSWYHLAITYDATNSSIFVNGVKQTSNANVSGVLNSTAGAKALIGAVYTGSVVNFANSVIDEAHIAQSAFSDAWIAAEYNNQSVPGNDGATGFWSIGTEEVPGTATFTVSPTAVPTSNTANIVLSLTGDSTTWIAQTFTISGVSGVTKISQAIASNTAATLTITTGSTGGTLTISDGTLSHTITVGMSGGGGGCAVVGVQ